MYVLYYILFPEWKIWSQFLHQTTGGLVKDALEQSHPIEVEMHHARSILEVFGDISYKKGSAVIRMLQSYLGDDIYPVCYNVVKISSEAIPDSANDLKQFFINLLLFPAEKLGWESMPGEDHFSALLRAEILRALVIFGHDQTQKEALHRFQTLLNDGNTPLLSADTKGVTKSWVYYSFGH
ncbi:hypothetical protein L3X38_016038 [Prunus dulcis]|uniref:Peptidase M1 membrane alanine aminopeptidase domain-containing protein n=1 Tax=Prunus dulcis TaxID=3755 RepID=A0AAD4W650_PRUDU|nr:hypothetical protein L3X38_016038 [Prunus dulcis]